MRSALQPAFSELLHHLEGVAAASAHAAAGAGRTSWASLRRKAWLLLAFGLVVALICTRATLTAVQEEKEVVQLAQELVAREAAVSRNPFAARAPSCRQPAASASGLGADCFPLLRQVVEAVRTEEKAKEMATAVDVVSEAARSMSSAQQDASAISGAAFQAAAALSSMEGLNSTGAGSAATGTPPQGEGFDMEAHERERKQAETESFALGEPQLCVGLLRCLTMPGCSCYLDLQLVYSFMTGQVIEMAVAWSSIDARRCYPGCAGAVTVNLKQMQDRVQSTLGTFETITAALEASTRQLRQEQALAVRAVLCTLWPLGRPAAAGGHMLGCGTDGSRRFVRTDCLLQERKAAKRLQHQLEQEQRAQAGYNETESAGGGDITVRNSTRVPSLLNATETAARAAVAASMGVAAEQDPVDEIIERIELLRLHATEVAGNTTLPAAAHNGSSAHDAVSSGA